MDAKQFIKYAGVFAAGAYTQHKYVQHQVFRDPGFLSLLDAALVTAKKEDIEQLVFLEPARLRDWVMAPEALRPALLRKWAIENKQMAEHEARMNEDEALVKAHSRFMKLRTLLGGMTFLASATLFPPDFSASKILAFCATFGTAVACIYIEFLSPVARRAREARRRLSKHAFDALTKLMKP